jgi:hypothetical protein
MTEQEKIRINELVFKSLESELSKDECRELELWISADVVSRTNYYSRCVDLCHGLSRMQQIISDPLHMTSYLQKMAEYERTAESIPFHRDDLRKEEISNIQPAISSQLRKSSRLPLYTAFTAIAALLLMLLYVYFLPRPASSQDVATIVDSINAKWLDPASSVKVGNRLWTNLGPVTLKEGLIAIRYDDGVEAVIQAPAEYELLTPTEIAINYGRLYAKVSDAGKGFTVKTRNSRIIDLGTEFGVLADVQGDTQLHVFKGRTTLIAGGPKKDKNAIDVTAGQAMEVDGSDAKAIELKKTAFARVINSKTGLVWNGEGAIDLADMVGGGDGLHGYNAAKGSVGQDLFGHPMLGPGEFLSVQNNPFIDGIFIPNGVHGPVPVTRDQSLLWKAPVTEVRQKIGYLRFDIDGVKGNRSGAQIGFNVSSWEGKKITLRIYGLKDGPADQWDESQICYNNALGFSASGLGQYTIDPDEMENLGTVELDGLGFKRSTILNLDLDSFIEKDSNGLLTFILVCDSGDPGDDWKMTTKEGNKVLAPRLTLPYAAGPASVDITTAQGRGADTYLSNDNQYASTGPYGSHGTEGVIKIRDYSKDPVYISNSPVIQYEEKGVLRTQALLAGGMNSETGDAVIGMRVISGITFDLRRIRSYYPNQVSLKSFTAMCGLVETASKLPKASFYVLVDGCERFSKLNMTPNDDLCAIEVKLTDQDSYLTLIAADGTDRKSARDWGFFTCPRLNIE